MTQFIKRFTFTLILLFSCLPGQASGSGIALTPDSSFLWISDEGDTFVVTPLQFIRQGNYCWALHAADSARISSLLNDLLNCDLSREIQSEIIYELKQIGVLKTAQNEALSGKLQKAVAGEEKEKDRKRNWRSFGLGSLGLNLVLILLVL